VRGVLCLIAASLLPVFAEDPGVEKIAALAAAERATILFTLPHRDVGVARNGHVEWIASQTAALSHDGTRVAWIAPGGIRVRDLASGTDRELFATDSTPEELAWSWDDQRLAVHDGRTVSAISVSTGDIHILLSTPSALSSLHWLHNNRDLVVQVAEKEDDEAGVYILSEATLRRLDTGSNPVVSPRSNRVAYYASKEVVAIDAEGTGRALLLRIRHAHPNRIVWSPEGGRLLLNRGDEIHLLNLMTHQDTKLIDRTAIRVLAWN